jgi:hypothetical protein
MSLPLLPGRECGGCVECCRVIPLSLPELSKPTGELCAYCVDGAGCSVHEIRPQTCRVWFCLWRVVELSDDWRPDRSGVILRPDGIEEGRMTLFVLRRSDFLLGEDLFTTVGHWLDQGLSVGLSVPGPVGTLPVRSDVSDWLRTATDAGDHDAFVQRLLAALDALEDHEFEPDGVERRYAVVPH